MIPFPDKKYSIIYADPPWSYCGKMMNSSVTDHYTTMTLDNICELPIEKICNDNCILFMWVTLPKLNEFMRVVNAWGFEYKTTAFVWVKQNKKSSGFFMGLGRWTRSNPEICIIATKGKISRIRNDIRQLQVFPIEEHSKKPDGFRNLIVELMGDLPRIELFARQRYKGWDAWGNQLSDTIQGDLGI